MEQTAIVELKVDENTTYNIIDWNRIFSESFNYQTNKLSEFARYLDTYENRTLPFWIEQQDNEVVKSVTEQHVPNKKYN